MPTYSNFWRKTVILGKSYFLGLSKSIWNSVINLLVNAFGSVWDVWEVPKSHTSPERTLGARQEDPEKPPQSNPYYFSETPAPRVGYRCRPTKKSRFFKLLRMITIHSGVEKNRIPDVFKWLKDLDRYFKATDDIRNFSWFFKHFWAYWYPSPRKKKCLENMGNWEYRPSSVPLVAIRPLNHLKTSAMRSFSTLNTW